METYDDMYFISLLFAYGADFHNKIENLDGKVEFSFAECKVNVYVLDEGQPTEMKDLIIPEIYTHYQRRKLLYPPNFPDGRRRFLELLHAKKC